MIGKCLNFSLPQALDFSFLIFAEVPHSLPLWYCLILLSRSILHLKILLWLWRNSGPPQGLFSLDVTDYQVEKIMANNMQTSRLGTLLVAVSHSVSIGHWWGLQKRAGYWLGLWWAVVGRYKISPKKLPLEQRSVKVCAQNIYFCMSGHMFLATLTLLFPSQHHF